jgi:phosphoribosylformylglycinamidine cyclo-ligase
VIDASSWKIPPIFRLIEKLGPVAREEMYRTFNMGIGYIMVVPPEEAAAVISALDEEGISASRIGTITPLGPAPAARIQINP